MKKFLFGILPFLMVALVSMTFTACSSDDDDETGNDNVLVGSWYGSISDYKSTLTFNRNGKGKDEWSNRVDGVVKKGVEEFNYAIVYYNEGLGEGMIRVVYTAGMMSGNSYNQEFTVSGNKLYYDGLTWTKR
jgi:hypothetical protein